MNVLIDGVRGNPDMINLNFTVPSSLDPTETITALEKLFQKRHIKYQTDGLQIKSTSIPLPLGNWEKAHYSRDNWIGMNPFVKLSSITCSVITDRQKTHVKVQTSTIRPLLVILILLICFVTSLTQHIPLWVKTSPLILSILYYLFTVSILIKITLPAEIKKCLLNNSGTINSTGVNA